MWNPAQYEQHSTAALRASCPVAAVASRSRKKGAHDSPPFDNGPLLPSPSRPGRPWSGRPPSWLNSELSTKELFFFTLLGLGDRGSKQRVSPSASASALLRRASLHPKSLPGTCSPLNVPPATSDSFSSLSFSFDCFSPLSPPSLLLLFLLFLLLLLLLFLFSFSSTSRRLRAGQRSNVT